MAKHSKPTPKSKPAAKKKVPVVKQSAYQNSAAAMQMFARQSLIGPGRASR